MSEKVNMTSMADPSNLGHHEFVTPLGVAPCEVNRSTCPNELPWRWVGA